MPMLVFTLDLNAPLDALWQFHGDVTKALPLLSPPKSDVRIVIADLPARLGQRVEMTVRGPLGVRLRWVARVVEFNPPAESGKGKRIARFVDEQESGPFSAWRHEHDMEEISPKRSRLTDRVTYRLPMGPLGVFPDRLFVRRQLEEMFKHRHQVTEQELRAQWQAGTPRYIMTSTLRNAKPLRIEDPEGLCTSSELNPLKPS